VLTPIPDGTGWFHPYIDCRRTDNVADASVEKRVVESGLFGEL
jgi:hypothetical protein